MGSGEDSAALTPVGSYGHGGRYGTYCFIDPSKDMIGIFLIHREGGSDDAMRSYRWPSLPSWIETNELELDHEFYANREGNLRLLTRG